MQVSVFSNIREIKNPKTRSVSTILNAIKTGKLKKLVTAIRNESNKKTRQELKKKLPCILFSGTFTHRADDAMIKHSGLICLDFDEFKDKEELYDFRNNIIKDKYTYSVFISPSGFGLKVLVKVPDEIKNHRCYFRGLEQHYNSNNFDNTCINESRVCYMSYDEDIYINENANTFIEKLEYQKEHVEQHKVEMPEEDNSKIIDGLYKWWESKYGLIDGERNRNVYVFAMALNEFGVTKHEAQNFCSQFAHGDFDVNEINLILSSAYNNTHLFNTKQFSKIDEYFKEVDLRQGENVRTKVNVHNIFESAFIDVTKKIEYPPTALSIGTHKISNIEYPTNFGTYGNFSCMVGASKSRKTFFKSLITGCYIGGESFKYASAIKSHRDRECFVIDIDTEQSPFHAQRVFKRTMNIVGVDNYEYYKPFALRPYDPKQRVEFLEWLIYESEFKNNIGWFCIDGLADLVNDFNDLKESNKVVQKVMKWTDEKRFHLTTILHSNFGSSKAVGHIGSSVLKKAETVCAITTEEDITNVHFSHTRGFPIDDIQFKINDDGIPCLLQDFGMDKISLPGKDTHGFTATPQQAFNTDDEEDIDDIPF